MLPTVVSDTPAVQQAAVDAIRQARADDLHGMIRPPQAQDIQWLCALQDLRVIVTLAPEHTQPGQIEQLVEAGILVCAGHTNATYQQVQQATRQGLHGITHLFNAMSPLTSREPGAVGAALDDDNLWAGIIADGHHVHPASIRLALSAKPAGKLVLVSDAMATVGGKSRSFAIYGEQIHESEGRLVNAKGVLAGSAIGMIDAVRYTHQTVGLPLAECLRMASLYPATILKLEASLGRLTSGYQADLVHFDQDFTVRNTWVAGQRAAHN